MVRRKKRCSGLGGTRRYDWTDQPSEWKRQRKVTTSTPTILNRRRPISSEAESPQLKRVIAPWWRSLSDGWSLLKAFCDNTALHGLRYITAEGMPIIHRLLWAGTCVAGLLGAGWLIWSVWLRYATSPTVTMVQDTSYPLYRIPFPAVTVCSVNKVLRTKAVKFVQEYTGENDTKVTGPYLSVVGALGLMSYPTYHRPYQYLNYTMQGRPFLRDVNITQLMLRVMPQCQDIFLACFWKGMAVNCCMQFLVQRTEEGFCYSFNSRTAEGLNKTHLNESLRRNNAAGATTGLEIFFKGQAGQAIEEFDILHGINVHIHHPDSFPDVAKGLFVPEATNKVMMAQVSPSQTVSTEEVKAVSKSMRRCYFPGEAVVTGLPAIKYQQDSCFMACRMHFLARVCNCTPYFFPRTTGVRECGASDLQCLCDNNGKLIYVATDLQRLCDNNAATRSNKPPLGTPGFNHDERALDCECLPPCTETQYSVESHYIQTSNMESKNSMGYVDVFFKQMGGVRYRNDVMFGWMDLLVSFGGIASLFLGFSLLSAAELLYWLVASIAVFLRMRKQQKDSSTQVPKRLGWMFKMPRRRPASLGCSPNPSYKRSDSGTVNAREYLDVSVSTSHKDVNSYF